MAGFGSLRDFLIAEENGRNHYSFWRKTPSQTTTAGIWFDMSMSPGNPPPQYYAASPLVFQTLSKSGDGGINHGVNVGSTYYKFLKRFLIMSASATGLPMPFILADYLGFYPFIDESINDIQTLTNSSSITRYTDGVGVKIMAVSVAPASGATSPTISVSYTNSDGTSGRTTPNWLMNLATANGSILSSDTGATISASPFIPLQSGDLGVRSIESVTVTSGSEVGLFALVLVKPLLTSVLLEQTAPTDVVPHAFQAQMPRIYDDAFLNLITLPNGSLSGVAFHGEIETIFG